MPRVVKRSASQAITSGPSRRGVPLPQFVPPQLSQPVEQPPSGPQWVHEIKLDGFRMAARIDNGRAQLLTRTGLDWTAKYPNAIDGRPKCSTAAGIGIAHPRGGSRGSGETQAHIIFYYGTGSIGQPFSITAGQRHA